MRPHFLYFNLDPHGHGSLRPILSDKTTGALDTCVEDAFVVIRLAAVVMGVAG